MTAENTEDATAAGTKLDLRAREHGHEDWGEVLQDVPAVRVRRTGAAGSFIGAALRGADADHTAVLLDTVPLHAVDAGAFDLSTISLSALDSVEVYRGGAPAWYSEGAIGGVLRLVPRRAVTDLLRGSLTVGPYGLRSGRATAAHVAHSEHAPAILAHVSGTVADNDYPYLDDRQTRFDDSDDAIRRQRNADMRSLNGLLHGGVDVLGGRLELMALGFGREAGIPGPLSRPTRDVRQQLTEGLLGLTYLRERVDGDGTRLSRIQWTFGLSGRRNRVQDEHGELGMQAADTDDRTERGFMRLGLSQRLLPWVEGTLIATFAHDSYTPQDDLAFTQQAQSTRSTWTVVAEPRLFGRPFGMRAELRPSIRAALSRSVLHGQRGLTTIDEDDTEVYPTYRIAGLLEPLPHLSLTSSVASGTRLPTMVELFGDRVFREANPQLLPEQALSLDVGAMYRVRTPLLRATLEVRGFMLSIDDLIQYVQTSQKTVRPENLSFSGVLGLEVGLRATLLRCLSLTTALTWMQTENPFELQLAYHPPLQALVRPDVKFDLPASGTLILFGEVRHIADVYLDKANLTRIPGRTTLALGASAAFFSDTVRLSARLENVFDTPATDVIARPLPGRQLLLTLSGGHGH